jgi:type I restriction enzyme, S subunit
MNRYENYFETGYEWIGEIPSSWELSRVGKFFTERSEKVDDVTYPPLSVTMNGIVDQLSDVAKSNDNNNRKLVKKDDFVINSRSDRKGSSGIAPRDGSVSLINIVLAPKNIDPKYIENLFKSYYFKEEYFRNGKGIHWDLWTTRWEQFKNINIPIPPIEEQKLISRYLDKKTTQIDSLVKKIQKKIELLKEQRTSLINHYVTKGLDPNVEMKDSGVEWVDRIPKTWSKSRLDFLTKLNGRLGWKSLKSDEYVEEGYVFLSTPNIKNWDIDFVNVNYITEERYVESPEIMLEEGDVLLVKDGSTLGITNYVRNLPRPSTVNSSIGVLKTTSSQLLPEFLFWSLSGNYIQNVIQRIKGGMGVPHLFQSDIKKFVVFLPPIEDQLEICQFLNYQIPKLNELIKSHVHKINCYKEYRQSLVSSVVTGKVRVTEDMI